MTEIDLSDQGLTEVPADVLDDGDEVEELNLANNRIQELPPSIGNLSNLYSLDLSHNQLRTLPKELGKLSNLAALNLSGNRLTAVPAVIGRLTNLQSLALDNNALLTLCALPKLQLQNLSIHNNPIVDRLQGEALAIYEASQASHEDEVLREYQKRQRGGKRITMRELREELESLRGLDDADEIERFLGAVAKQCQQRLRETIVRFGQSQGAQGFEVPPPILHALTQAWPGARRPPSPRRRRRRSGARRASR
jgi:Leucine-rich repeat (LRR) protein